jgi:hypothetical protein
VTTEFCVVAPNIFQYSRGKLLYVTLQAEFLDSSYIFGKSVHPHLSSYIFLTMVDAEIERLILEEILHHKLQPSTTKSTERIRIRMGDLSTTQVAENKESPSLTFYWRTNNNHISTIQRKPFRYQGPQLDRQTSPQTLTRDKIVLRS